MELRLPGLNGGAGYATGAFVEWRETPEILMPLLRRHVDVVEVTCTPPRLARILADPTPLDAAWRFVSLHAPADPAWLGQIELLLGQLDAIVAHPDALPEDREALRALGTKLCLEHLDPLPDGTARYGQTAAELEVLFEQLPEARVVFDTAHLLQTPTRECERLIDAFSERLSHVHVSWSRTHGDHREPTRTQLRTLAGLLAPMPEVPIPLSANSVHDG